MPWFHELKRRNVFKVAAAYAVVAFVLLQVADLLVPALLLPDWTFRLLGLLALMGFPVALVLAWAFELTPEGVKRTEFLPGGVDAPRSPSSARPRVLPLASTAGVVLIGVAGAGWWVGRDAGPGSAGAATADPGGTAMAAVASEDRSIAVLPFTNVSGDPENEYFSDGMTEDILTSLALMRDLRVISRTSVMQYKGTTKSLPEIGRELGVRYVLEGSVRRVGDRVRITGQLIEVESDTHLWANNYDREVADVFAIQTEIARAIADALQARLSEAESARLAAAPPTASIAAYEEYLKGRQLFRESTPEAWEAAIAHQRRAVALDPDFGLAHAALSELMGLQFHGITGDSVALRSAAAAANRAIELVPDRPEAWLALARTRRRAGAHDEVEPLVERALELNPNDPEALGWHSGFLITEGRLADALHARKRAAEVDPSDAIMMLPVANSYRTLGQYDLAESWIERAAALDYESFRFARAEVLRDQGRHDEALEEARAWIREAGETPSRHILLAAFEFNAGAVDQALERLERAGRELPHFAPHTRRLRVQIYRSLSDEAGLRRTVEEARAAGDTAMVSEATLPYEEITNRSLENLRRTLETRWVNPGELRFGLDYALLRNPARVPAADPRHGRRRRTRMAHRAAEGMVT